jgi:hypothetical protein
MLPSWHSSHDPFSTILEVCPDRCRDPLFDPEPVAYHSSYEYNPDQDPDQEQEQGRKTSRGGTKTSSTHGHSQAVVSVQVVVLDDLRRCDIIQYQSMESVDFIGYRE